MSTTSGHSVARALRSSVDALRFFAELGDLVDGRWFSHGYDDDRFADVACRALEEMPPNRSLSWEEVLTALRTTSRLPPQTELYSREQFGDLPLTVFRAPRFHIDALFWSKGTTSIHQHGFDGAFHVMSGSSIHSKYSFHEKQRFTNRVRIGQLQLEDLAVLETGAIRPIQAGDRLIHSLFHLDQPSVSIVVRTGRAPDRPIQFSYEPPGLAYDPFHRDPLTIKRVQSLELLHVMRDPRYDAVARGYCETADPLSLVHLCWAIYAQLQDVAKLRSLLRGIESPYQALLAVLESVFDNRFRVDTLIAGRELVTDRNLRFFLAVLLNVNGMENTLRLMEGWCATDGATAILDSMRDLSRTEWCVDGLTNSLNIAIDEHSLAVLRNMLRGATRADIIDRMRDEYDDADVSNNTDTILRLYECFRDSILLRSLFATGRAPEGFTGTGSR